MLAAGVSHHSRHSTSASRSRRGHRMQGLQHASVPIGTSSLRQQPCTCSSRTQPPMSSQWPSQVRLPAVHHRPAQSAGASRRHACSPSSSIPIRHIGHASRRRGRECRQAAYQQGAALGWEGEHNEGLEGNVSPPMGSAAPSAETLKRVGAGWNSWWFKSLAKLPKLLYGQVISLLDFIFECSAILPEFVVPGLSQALWRTGMVLAASLAMIIVISTIDSVWLYWYVLRARLGV